MKATLIPMLSSLSNERRAMVEQLARFIVSGAAVTALGVGVYAVVALLLKWNPQLGNFLAYAVAVATGYVMHSRWSFRGHGRRDNVLRTTSRFFVVALISLALNSFWVWLFTARLHTTPSWPILPMTFVTPLVTFALNRRWVFA